MRNDAATEGQDESGRDGALTERGQELRLDTSQCLATPLLALLSQIEEAGGVEISAAKESANFRRVDDGYFAVVDSAVQVVGYLSGTRKNGNAGAHAVDDGATVAFIRLLVVSPSHRDRGVGYRAVQLFAEHARGRTGASLLALRLDEEGDIDLRRARFERMGFRFEDLFGLVKIDDLLDEGTASTQAPAQS